jgi:hypothetical protein
MDRVIFHHHRRLKCCLLHWKLRIHLKDRLNDQRIVQNGLKVVLNRLGISGYGVALRRLI